MRRLVVCCDGTWNTPDQRKAGVPTPTNVTRIFHALSEDEDQLRYYHPGVGTGPGVIDRLRGGGLGEGLEMNVKSAYSWLATHYRTGDQICLFGFSRGAYTVRSVAGMIAACGLPTFPPELPVEQRWQLVDDLYQNVYRPPVGQPAAGRPVRADAPEITFLGVWDTVGALGIPDVLGPLRVLDVDRRHRFHDTELSSLVVHARHAVAIDETRGPFTPTLWRLPERLEPGHSVRQTWFPGGHCDVGGGHPQTGLSDGALLWMIEEARNCTDLEFRKEMLDQIRPDPCDVLHDDCIGFYRYLAPSPRSVPLIDVANVHAGRVHDSAVRRQARPPITAGDYRPGRVLAVGECTRFEVFAGQPWNDPGLFLDRGRYRFDACGAWLDGRRSVGPAGRLEWRFDMPEMFHPEGSFLGWWQDRYRALTRDDTAILFGAPRLNSAPWMALTGMVAGSDPDQTGAQPASSPFCIGDHHESAVDLPGYFYAFANDAWGFYRNNRGSVTLTVTRVS
jgi:uncharacterized protein (DUF2235 family)